MRLILQDVFGYETVNPAQFGTFYTHLNQTTGGVSVRGASINSNDVITVSTSGSQPTISIDVGDDVAATGRFSGDQNLPAFVTAYNLAAVDSIFIDSFGGADVIILNRIGLGLSTTIFGGPGEDMITIGGGDLDTRTNAEITINGGPGSDELVLDDSADGGSDTYTLTNNLFDKTTFGQVLHSSMERTDFAWETTCACPIVADATSDITSAATVRPCQRSTR